MFDHHQGSTVSVSHSLWPIGRTGSATRGAKEQFSNINKGIGMETTRALAQTGRFSKVYLTSRNPDNGLAALEEVRKTIQIPDMVEHHQLDITDRWSIEEFKVSL